MEFEELYRISSTHINQRDNESRHFRFKRLYDSYKRVLNLDGFTVDCGVLRGLSTHILCSILKQHDPNFSGHGVIAIDSFEGLSANRPEDGMDKRTYHKKKLKFTMPIETFSKNMADFPNITTIKGWIPEVLSTLPDNKYRFIHIDVDMYEPTLGCLKYFWPRLIPGGIIVCDDYSSYNFKGARLAIDKFCGNRIRKDVNVSAILYK